MTHSTRLVVMYQGECNNSLNEQIKEITKIHLDFYTDSKFELVTYDKDSDTSYLKFRLANPLHHEEAQLVAESIEIDTNTQVFYQKYEIELN